MSRSTPLTLPLTLGMLAVSAAAFADPPTYHLTNLGDLGGPGTYARAINNNGQISGEGTTAAHQESAFFYNGSLHALGFTGNGSSINASGVIAGAAQFTVGGPVHAISYDGTVHDIGTLGGPDSFAYAINDGGAIVGASKVDATSTLHAFSYDGTMHDLGTLGGTNSYARGINAGGTIVGYSYMADLSTHAFLYDGTMHDLGTLGGNQASAYAINNGGKVVGTSDMATGGSDAFLFDGTMHDLGRLSGTYALATAINSGGLGVGYASLAGDAVTHATFFDGGAFDLNNYLDASGDGWELAYATGINDSGQIAGYGLLNGDPTSFLLTPDVAPTATPEPSAFAILGIGGIGTLTLLLGLRRRKRN